MPEHRWFSSSQPQTLQIAVVLLYFNAALGLLDLLVGGGIGLLSLIFVVGQAAAGFGIANERKWGYITGIVFAILPFLVIVATFVLTRSIALDWFSLIFEIALLVALLHEQSRSYYKLWFRSGRIGLPGGPRSSR